MENKELNKNNNQLSTKSNYGVFDPFFDNFFRFPSLKNEFKDLDKLMKTDIQENENNYLLEIDMPGIDKKDINIELSNGYLTVSTHKDYEGSEQNKSDSYVRRERFIGNIARTFYVGDISEDCVKASLDKGVLNVCIPKENCSTRRKIEIL